MGEIYQKSKSYYSICECRSKLRREEVEKKREEWRRGNICKKEHYKAMPVVMRKD
jgi:hypothetical protein